MTVWIGFLLAIILLVVAGLAQETVDFGAIPVGATVSATYTLRNTNPFPCTLEAVGFGEDFAPATDVFNISGLELPLPLESGASVQWAILFRPSATAVYQEEMRITAVKLILISGIRILLEKAPTIFLCIFLMRRSMLR